MESPARPDPVARSTRPRLIRWLVIFAIVGGGLGSMSMLGSKRPAELGVRNGKLAACPDKPNCVSTQADDDAHAIAPLRLQAGPEAAMAAAINEVNELPRTTLITQEKFYLHAECRSLIFRFVDDLELWIDAENRMLHARSASRVGYSDLGVNRQRVEDLFGRLIEAGVAERP